MSQFTYYPPVSDKQLGFSSTLHAALAVKPARWPAKTKTIWKQAAFSAVSMTSTAGVLSLPGRAGSATTYLLIRFPFHVTTVRTRSAPKIVRPLPCINVRATASCALIPTNASAVAIAPGPALTARRSLTSRQVKCPSATCASSCRRKVNSPSVSRPVRWRPSSLALLMNCARSTAAYVT